MVSRTAESGIDALKDALEGMATATVLRNVEVPKDVPDAGLIIIRDGEQGEPYSTTIGITPVYSYKHEVEVEFYIAGGVQSTRDAAMDVLLRAASTAIAADRTLAGTVTRAMPSSPVPNEKAFPGAEQIKAMLVSVELDYDTTDPLQ